MQNLFLYDGRVQLFFDPGPHKYYVEIDDGERKQVDSATQVLNIINKPALLPWAVKMTVEWLKEKWEPGRAYDEIEIESLLKESKSARFKKSGRALSIGSLVHDWMEDCVNLLIDEKMVLVTDPETKEMVSLLCQTDEDDPEVVEMKLPFNEEAQNGVRAFISWNEEHNVEWLASEKKTYSIDGNYSGTLDGDAVVDGKRSLIDFKGLPLNTPLPTPNGWTTIKDVRVGDTVFDKDGQPTTVTGKSEVHKRKTYRIVFDDGSEMIADDEHQWLVDQRRNQKMNKNLVMTTEEMVSYLSKNEKLKSQDAYCLYIQNPKPLYMTDRYLSVDPYVYGVWLGDGSVNGGKITGIDIDIFEECKERGYDYGDPHGNDESKAPTRTLYGLRTDLRISGLKDHRNVPQRYLRASIEQRLELLRGLMDSDGTWNGLRKSAVFNSSNPELAKTVEELALSLGERPYRVEVDVEGFGLKTKSWRVAWRPTRFNPFLLPRKADEVTISNGISHRRQIKSVEETEKAVATQCIEVDSKSSTYLATRKMIPTHNTSKRIYDEYWLQCACYVHAQEEEARFVGEIDEDDNLFEQIVILRVPKDKAEFEAQYESDRDVIDNWIDVFFALLKANEWKNGN